MSLLTFASQPVLSYRPHFLLGRNDSSTDLVRMLGDVLVKRDQPTIVTIGRRDDDERWKGSRRRLHYLAVPSAIFGQALTY